ncbi:MAG: phosphotransferase [Candidatus Fermentibacteraceae bacterium]|nr:phosphotransferase [Candidatus Fermentibacteraceae bacterium]
MDDMDFTKLLGDEGLCAGLAGGIAEKHGIGLPGQRIRQGSNLLFGFGDGLVLKLFSRDESYFRDNEALFLRKLDGRLSVKVPALHHTGELEGYPYLIMDRLDGSPLETVWDTLDRPSKLRLSSEAGALLKELHSLPTELAQGCVPDWGTFIEGQKESITENHAGYGLDPSRIDEIIDFIDDFAPIEEFVSPVVCHTEIMREHLFVTGRGGNTRLSGVIDFEPSMLAVPQYDLCAVGLFVTSGDPELFGAFLESYGSSEDTSVPSITRMLLLHRYSNMNWFISTLPVDLRGSDLLTMGDYWFGRP